MDARLYIFRASACFWMLLIFVLSYQPHLPLPRLFSMSDLLAHAVFYGVLCALLARSLMPPEVTTWKRMLLLTVLVTAYGVTDEYHQSYVPGRDASPWGVLADGIGGFMVAWTMHWRYRRAAQIA